MSSSHVLDLSNKARKSLEGLEIKQFKQVAMKMLSLLRDPFPNDSEKLTGSEYRRVDIGEYRIVYNVKEDVVQILAIGERNDGTVYKRL